MGPSGPRSEPQTSVKLGFDSTPPASSKVGRRTSYMARTPAGTPERAALVADGLEYQPTPDDGHYFPEVGFIGHPGRSALGWEAHHRPGRSGDSRPLSGPTPDLGVLSLRDRLGRLERPPIARSEPFRQLARRQVH